MVILPGVALAASRGFSQTPQSALAASSGSGTPSHKAIVRYSRRKSSYKVPKNAAKQAKYIAFLTTLLSLSPEQQDQAASIFATASAAVAEVKKNKKASRQALGESVSNNDGNRIRQTSVAIGALTAQHHSIGASANAAFFQLLTSDQQAKLTQFRS
jgi:Spy/CpxP family protein refolding chaperone